MRLIPFFSRSLRFFFARDSPSLEIVDKTYLPYSFRFLGRVYYYRRKLTINNVSLPLTFCIEDKKIMLILNKDYSIVSIPVSKICALKRIKFVLHSTYNNKIYNNIINITNNNKLYKAGNGELHISPPLTGMVVFYDEDENEEEIIEVGTGMLSIYSPDEILQKYM
ncbi:MAG: hypothetical protein FHOMOCKG_00022 [Methanophagales virus GBV302]|uniref:Uncharacterized protein n=1 Tax=Methanophagales virus GBV302 TaxID=2999281 RepID=A0A9E9A8G9_9CAUD|nr:MAG: hypothetical protein QIT37_gp022 [Methanophagales virus GBV302]WAE39550.1 MAG: hypothetical protein FHOMOCKG_00022 [Methanophagales virus GBV302]